MTQRRSQPAEPSDRDLADRYDQSGVDLSEWGDPEAIQKPDRLDVTISVRFSAAEIALIRALAAEAGIKPTSFIRRCALAADRPVDKRRLARSVDALARNLDEPRRAAG